MKTIKTSKFSMGREEPLLIIGGPCVLESAGQSVDIAGVLRDRCRELGMGFVFKGSFDKANRSSIHSQRGPGLENGLGMLKEVAEQLGVAVTTDIHESAQAGEVGEVVDIIQIPAFLCRQTDLLAAAAETGKVINVKKGQFLSPAEMTNVIQKLAECSAREIVLTERGTFFGYHRLVNDFVGLGDMMELGYPVCFDVTHSTQQPGGQGHQSGGRPDRAALLARAAVAAGVQALFIETHPEPSKALSDAATMLKLSETVELLGQVARIREAM